MSAYWQTMVRTAFDDRADRHRPQTREEMRLAVHELRERGMTDDAIANATGLAVEQVRELLGEAP